MNEPTLMKSKLRVFTRVVKKMTVEPGMFTFINGRCPIKSSVS